LEKKLVNDKDYLNNEKMKELYDKIPGFLNTTFHEVHDVLARQKYDT
jgi:hypothetical protein|tara:strand:+ start:491 stop:631 length:141 start_codon:yes stop_codon:yes gene_type:complete